jgi:tetratricopeptide (TPR) repeat protein
MFMVRLRRSAKWAFIVLIFAFAFSFLFAGVGGGGSGGDIIQELLGMRGGSDPVKSAENDVAKHPRNASALNRLALAYGVEDRRGDAINAYKKYLKLKPNDQSGFAQLARLQEEVTALRWNRYAAVQSEMAAASGPLGSDPVQILAGTDPLLSAYTSLLTTKLSNAYGSYTTAAKAWESTNKSYVKSIPKTNTLLRANVELQLAQAASSAADYTTAIKSYENFLRLTPKSPLAAQVKKILADLQKASSSR